MNASPLPPRLAVALYRRLLVACPRPFVREYGDELVLTFREMAIATWDRGGVLGLVVLLSRALRDLAATARAERRSARAGSRPLARPRGASLPDVARASLVVALRGLRARPGFTAVAVATLALGIGANAAMIELAYPVFLKPLPYHEPERLVSLWEAELDRGGAPNSVSPANFESWRAATRTLTDLAAFAFTSLNLTGDAEPERLEVQRVSGSFFRALGVDAALGRVLTDDDDRYGAPRVAVLGHGFWRRRFGGRASIVGESIQLDDRPYRVLGILPPGFRYPMPSTDVYVPFAMDPQERSQTRSHYLRVLGRLAKNRSMSEAREEMSAVAEHLARERPEANGDTGVFLLPLRDDLVGDAFAPILLLVAAVFALLLIACVNVTNLLLSRAASRKREVAVRAALGAGRMRLLADVAVEAALLASAAGALGLLIQMVSGRYLRTLAPESVSPGATVGLVPETLAFTFGLTLLTGLVVGVSAGLPGIHGLHVAAWSRGGLRGGHHRHGRTRKLLVAVEVGAALLLLCASALMLQSLRGLLSVEPGFRPENVLTMRVEPSRTRYAEPEDRMGFYRSVLDRIERHPDVASAGFSTALPLKFRGGSILFGVEDRPDLADVEPLAALRSVTPGYFRAMGIPVLRGRAFDENDDQSHPPVALVNEAMVRRYFPDGDPLGERLTIWGDVVEIVGVVGDVREFSVAEPAPVAIYAAAYQRSRGFFDPRDLAVRIDRRLSEVTTLGPTLRAEIWSVDADQPVSQIESLERIVAASVGDARDRTWLLGLFSALALALSAIGIYGVLSHAFAQRAGEIGLRLALGARRGDVLALVVREGMRWTLLGVAAGLAGALALSRSLDGLLYEVDPLDPWVLAVTTCLLLAVALLACLLPAVRAARVEPVVALRAD